MTAILAAAVVLLLMLSATLAALLVGRALAATREETRLRAVCARLDAARERAEAKVRHYQARNAELRDEVDAYRAAPDPSLVEDVTATLAALDITYPGDQR